MDVTAPEWDAYEERFNAVAELATPWPEPTKPDLASLPIYLCLYGDNGLTPTEEWATLTELEAMAKSGHLYCLTVDADYWFERILFTL